MTTLTNTTGNKAVKISKSGNGTINAAYVQYTKTGIDTQEDLLQLKSFSSEKTATKWANKILA
jgi:hypothetical protein